MTILRNLALFLVAVGTFGLGIVFGLHLTENTTLVGLVAATAVAGYVLFVVYSTVLVIQKVRGKR